MTKTRIAKKRKKRKEKKGHPNSQAPLCALGEVVRAKEVFEPIHQGVSINQKTVVYRPTDKLVLTVVGILSGAQNLSELNTELRADKVLLESFGYSRCAEQSVIQQRVSGGEVVCVDIDLSALPVSKNAAGSEKGYVAGRKNQYTRQLARGVISDTQEIVCQCIHEGKTGSAAVFKPTVLKLERVMGLDTRAKRGQVQLRFDAGFGT